MTRPFIPIPGRKRYHSSFRLYNAAKTVIVADLMMNRARSAGFMLIFTFYLY